MFAQQYDHGIIRRYTIAFGNLFNDIVIQRNNETTGGRIQTIAVPLIYASKESFYVRMKNDPNLERETAISLPAMGFTIVDFQYDSERKLTSTSRNTCAVTTGASSTVTQFVPVPYNLIFNLNIFVRYTEDGTQILEQILPYFRPQWTTSVKTIPSMDISVDAPVILNGVSVEDIYEGDFVTRQALIYTLDFTVKAWLYGPTENKGIITRSIVRERDLVTEEVLDRIDVTELDC